MISEVDEALRRIVAAASLNEVDVVFDAPTKDWAARRNAPTVNLYLYDIREDVRRRERGYVEEYDDTGTLVARRPAPKYFKLSYLVSAWTQRPDDEHRLLDALLRAFLRHEALPRDLITGALAETGLVVPMSVGLPPPEDRAFADVWSALGGELKPSLDLVVAAPIDTGVSVTAGPPVTEPLHLEAIDTIGGGTDRVGGARPSPTEVTDPRRRRHRPGSSRA